MLYTNANIFMIKQSACRRNGRLIPVEEGCFVPGSFVVENGRFQAVLPDENGEVLPGSASPAQTEALSDPAGTAGRAPEEVRDLCGAYVIPGLIDIHTHGAMGADFSDGDAEGLARMAAYLAANGITSFAPASMTLPYETLAAAFETAADFAENRRETCARLMGINMEGPFFSEKKKGAQNAAYLRLPDAEAVSMLSEKSRGLLRLVDVAPELEGAVPFIEEVKKTCTVSVAHTDADYDQAKAAFDAGATHLTHLFNAMPSIHHRKPGVIGAASENDAVIAELICDGLHVHPSAVRMAFQLFPGRICLISDSLRCCGMPDGEYELGGQPVFLQGGVARLADGTIAGAASCLYTDMRNAISFGIPREEAILAATIRPAREIGQEKEIGSIEPGKLADFVICTEDLQLQEVILGGQPI